MATVYKKHFLPLESNPNIFNDLMYSLGVPRCLEFQDVVSLDDSELPRPGVAVILIFPTTSEYTERVLAEDSQCDEHQLCKDAGSIVWFKQTINNACGLYGILHAVCNGPASTLLGNDSLITGLREQYIASPFKTRSDILENCFELEKAYQKVARQGDSKPATSAEDEVDFHYKCFVKSLESGSLFELDGDRKGPIDTKVQLNNSDDIWTTESLNIFRDHMESEQGNANFCMLALVSN